MHHTLSPKSPHANLCNSLLFAPPFLFLIVRGGTGLVSILYLLLALVAWRRVGRAIAPHWRTLWPLLLAFALPLVLAVATWLGNDDMRLREFERPVRALACMAALGVVLAWRPPRKWLWWGVIAGAVAGAVLIGVQRWVLGMDRPGGWINAITFGDVALLLGLLSMVVFDDVRQRAAAVAAHRAGGPAGVRKAAEVSPQPGRALRLVQALALVGAAAGIIGSMATGTRGSWLGALFALPLLLRYGGLLASRRRQLAALLALAVLAATFAVPHSSARERTLQGIADVQQYFAGGDSFTNVGVRLELWRGATLMIADHPWGLRSMAAVVRAKEAMVARGELPPYVLEFDHFHNDALHATVFGGVWGLLAWAGTLLLPFLFFRHQWHAGRIAGQDGGGPAAAPALAGMVLVASYFGFGLTEVIFWTIHSAVFYALMVFMLAGLCLTAASVSPSPDTTRS